jgi:hypothetical protein
MSRISIVGWGAKRAAVALASACAFAAMLVVLVLHQLFAPLPSTAGAVPTPFGPPIAQHTLLVILDGLRDDVARDPARMPRLRARLDAYGDTVLLASPVSMTSAAVLLMGTGERGDLEQMVANEAHKPTNFDSVFRALHEAGATTAAIGDHVWPSLYPGAWTIDHTEATHSLEVDEDDAILADALEVLGTPEPPRFTVLHVNTPDHKGHGHGITSGAYTNYIQHFDIKLDTFLASLSPRLSVIVTSDHGATDSGSHGSDTEVQRRSPFLAYGPGLAAHPRAAVLDQADMAATLAALTGVRPPTHDRGHVAPEILAVDEAEAARLACVQLANVHRFARAVVGPDEDTRDADVARCPEIPLGDRFAYARALARTIDDHIGNRRADSPKGFLPGLFAVTATLLAIAAVAARGQAAAVVATVTVAVPAVVGALAATWGLELLPGLWPDRARIAAYVLGNLPLVALLVWPRKALRVIDRNEVWGPLVLPGALLLTEPKTTQAEAFAVLAIVSLVVLCGRHRARRAPLAAALRRHGPAFLALPFLAVPGVLDDSYAPRWIADRPLATGITADAFVAAFLLWRVHRRETAPAKALLTFGLTVGALALRDVGPTWAAIAGWALGLATLGMIAIAGARGTAGASHLRVPFEAALLFVFALVSRNLEWPYLVAAVVLATHLAEELARDDEGSVPLAPHLLLVTAAFACAYVGRVGVQQGFHFLHMDWGAGAFHDPNVGPWRIGFGIATKHVLAIFGILGAMSFALPTRMRALLWRGMVLASLARIAVIALMLHVCRHSFWTPVWVVGELPNTLIAMLVSVFVIATQERPHAADDDAPLREAA